MIKSGSQLACISLLAGCLCFSTYTFASSQDFTQAYQAYNQAVTAGDKQQTVLSAQQAFDLGKKLYGKDSIDTANLSFNLAIALAENKQDSESQPYFDLTLDLYKSHYGDESIEIIDPLLTYADKTKDIKLAKSLLSEARDIAQDSDKPILYAHTLSASFTKLINSKYDKPSVRRYILKAKQIYSENLPNDAAVLVNARYDSAAVYFADKKYDKAEAELLEVINQYERLEYSHPYELASHAKLVSLYSQRDEPEQATEHCIAIGSMKPWSPDQQQTPIYRVNPKFPQSKAKRRTEGMVQLSFTVDEQGFVINPEILKSKGGKAFETESIKVLKEWRYAPKFVDGKPVKAESTVQLDYTFG
ncbi:MULTISPECIES: TonB family protein [unclassified Shewanella]|uniref:TonB family protein n=1 Tax=unclassified Shewanella TaxID=196818 RepID=UPI00354B4A20